MNHPELTLELRITTICHKTCPHQSCTEEVSTYHGKKTSLSPRDQALHKYRQGSGMAARHCILSTKSSTCQFGHLIEIIDWLGNNLWFHVWVGRKLLQLVSVHFSHCALFKMCAARVLTTKAVPHQVKCSPGSCHLICIVMVLWMIRNWRVGMFLFPVDLWQDGIKAHLCLAPCLSDQWCVTYSS